MVYTNHTYANSSMIKNVFFLGFVWVFICLFYMDVLASDYAPPSEASLFSDPEQIAHVLEENAGGCHSLLRYFQPVSGQWSLAATDLKVAGAQPLQLERILLSPHIKESYHQDPDWDLYRLHEQVARPGNGWTFLPECFMQAQVKEGNILCYVTDPHGMTLRFHPQKSNQFTLDMDSYGMHNGLQGLPSSRYDYRNSQLYFDSTTSHMVFTSSDGIQRFYSFSPTLCFACGYGKGRLEKTRLRNGMILHYSYDNKEQLTGIASFDPTETQSYARMSFSKEEQTLKQSDSKEQESKKRDKKKSASKKHDSKKQDKKACASTITSFCTTVCESNTGARAVWREEVFSGPITLKEKIKHGEKIWQCHLPQVRLLRSSQSSQNADSSFSYQSRFICSDIVTKEGKLRAEYALSGSNYRIKTLLRENNEGIYLPLYHFTYTVAEPGKSGGSTCIRLSDGSSIVYRINPNLTIGSISWKDPSGKTCKEERFVWNAQQWCERKEFYAEDLLVCTICYSYDARGNPILEEMSGDLTGNGSLAKNKIKRTFSQDALALLLSEEQENGRIDRYSYLSSTDLLQSHFVEHKGQIYKRTFLVYNAYNQLIEKQVDDGSSSNQNCLDGVTQCHRTCWKLRQSAPFLHLPERKEDYVLDKGKKRCTAISCYTYDTEGNIAKEERYDGKEQLFETLLKTYNARGDVLSETNALGQTATYTYDAYGRKTGEVPFSGDKKIQWLMDGQGHCTSCVIAGLDGIERRYAYSYDLYDQKTCEIDPLEERTEYCYSPLFGHLLRKQKPSTCVLSGHSYPVVEEYTYDGMGNILSKKNANGVVTQTKYTAYGKPHTIFHADGTQERFLYTLSGNLEYYTDREGLQTHYTWDIGDRMIAKTHFDKQGNLLAQERWEYNPFYLLRKVDREGHVTEYFYDAEGRVVEELIVPRSTRWNYDVRDNVKEVTYVNGEKTLHVHLERDPLGKVVEVRSTDDQGTLLKWEGASYDSAGRMATQEFLRESQSVKEYWTYDSQDRIVRYQDCNGAITTTRYGERVHTNNGKKQRIETKRITSPENEVTEIWYDAAGREWVLSKWDSTGKRVLHKEKQYDAAGNLLHHTEWFDDKSNAPHRVTYTYTKDQLVASTTRAAGTDLARTTLYTYTPEGLLASRQNPSGRSLYYSYDGLGFLQSIKASDGTVDQSLQHNRLGHLVKAVDLTTGLKLERTVDRFGSLLSETFPLDKRIIYQYDARGRLLQLDVTGLGSAEYGYDSLFLRSVKKISPEGQCIAHHRYTDYDLDGSLQQELLPADLSSWTYHLDPKGRLIKAQTPEATYLYSYDQQDRLLKKEENGPLENRESAYFYDGLSQLLMEEEDHGSQLYKYDGHGSRIEKNGEASLVNMLDEELQSGSCKFAYDLDGSRIQKTDTESGETWTYQYNALQQFTEASSETCRVQFAYDPLGRKIRRSFQQRENPTADWQETDCLYFLYQNEEEIGAYKKTGDYDSYRLIASPQNTLIPRTLYVELGDAWYVPKVDQQGTITHLLDPYTARVAYKQRLTVFGEALNSDSSSLVCSPWSYLSKRLDPDLGLFDFGRRWYDPKQARWTTLDPAGFIDGTNLYRYAKNNPLLYLDPNGEFAIAVTLVNITWSGITWLTSEVALTVAAAAAATYGTYKACEYIDHQNEERKQAECRAAIRPQELDQHVYYRKTKKFPDHDPLNYIDLKNHPDWDGDDHEESKNKDRRKLKNRKTGEVVAFDKGDPSKPGHGQYDHYHRENPNATGKHDAYIDNNGNPCRKNKPNYHLYNPNVDKWDF